MATNGKIDFVKALSETTAEDLAAVNAKIADLERQLAEYKGVMRKEIDALKAVGKIISLRLNGRPAKKTADMTNRGAKIGLALKMRHWRNNAVKYLTHAGPTKPLLLAESLGVPHDKIDEVLKHEWFERAGDHIRLSAAGKKWVA